MYEMKMTLTGLVFGIFIVCGVAGEVVKIRMPVLDVPEDGAYMCFKVPVDDYAGMSLGKLKFLAFQQKPRIYSLFKAVDTVFLLKIGYELTNGIGHHAVLLACEDVNSDVDYWDCSKQQGYISKGRAVGLNGLDRTMGDTDRFDFPEDTGIELGPDAKINYMVLQVHYKDKRIVKPNDQSAATATLFLTKERRQFSRHVAMMFAKGYIPPNQEIYSSEQIFKWAGVTVAVDNYAVHAHGKGLLMESYIIKKDNISLIGRHHPHEHGVPLYSMTLDKPLYISPGDVLVNRCLHKNPSDDPIRFGTAEEDEMCTLTIWFKVPTDQTEIYARPIIVGQDPQEISWCNNNVYTSHELCQLSKTNH